MSEEEFVVSITAQTERFNYSTTAEEETLFFAGGDKLNNDR